MFRSGVSAVFETLLAPRGISHQPFFSIQGSRGEIVINGFKGGCNVYTIGNEFNNMFDSQAMPQDNSFSIQIANPMLLAKGKGHDDQICTEICNEGWDASYEVCHFLYAVHSCFLLAGP